MVLQLVIFRCIIQKHRIDYLSGVFYNFARLNRTLIKNGNQERFNRKSLFRERYHAYCLSYSDQSVDGTDDRDDGYRFSRPGGRGGTGELLPLPASYYLGLVFIVWVLGFGIGAQILIAVVMGRSITAKSAKSFIRVFISCWGWPCSLLCSPRSFLRFCCRLLCRHLISVKQLSVI